MTIFIPQPGALRFTGADGRQLAANPPHGDLEAAKLYAALRIAAQEGWIPGRGWIPLTNEQKAQ